MSQKIAAVGRKACGLQPASCLDFTGRRDNVCGWALNIYWHNLLCVGFLVESDLNSVLSLEPFDRLATPADKGWH